MTKLKLALIQEEASIAAVICKRTLMTAEFMDICRRPLEGNLTNTLQQLYNDCMERGYGKAWTGEIIICLPASSVIFQDFTLPPTSVTKAKKTVPILLDGEFPFEKGDFVTKTIFIRDKALHSLSILVPGHLLNAWREACSSFSASALKIFISPLPIIASLPKTGSPALLLCLDSCGGSISALDKSAKPLRIQPLQETNLANNAEKLARQIRLHLHNLQFSPQIVYVYGNFSKPSITQVLAREFDCPALALGVDIPLARHKSRLEEDDNAYLLGLCLLGRLPWNHWQIPTFNFRYRKKKEYAPKGLLYPCAAVLALLGLAGAISFLDSFDKYRQARVLKQAMYSQLKRALPDAPANASQGRLQAILDSRLRNLQQPTHKAHSFMSLLDSMHATIRPSLNLDIHRLQFDENHLRIYGHADNYDDVEILKTEMDGLDGIDNCRIVNAVTKTDQAKGGKTLVEFELDLTRIRQ